MFAFIEINTQNLKEKAAKLINEYKTLPAIMMIELVKVGFSTTMAVKVSNILVRRFGVHHGIAIVANMITYFSVYKFSTEKSQWIIDAILKDEFTGDFEE